MRLNRQLHAKALDPVNTWDKLSHYFEYDENIENIDTNVADNILIAWPSLLNGITKIQSNITNLYALDYGCGGGAFCQELLNKNYIVEGCDSSADMIAYARKRFSHIKFYESVAENIYNFQNYPYDLITSIMVFQFIEHIDDCFLELQKAIKPKGVLAFAVFNPGFVTNNHGHDKEFDNFLTPDNPTDGLFVFNKNIQIPVFIRTENDYDKHLERFGFKRIYLDKPIFSTYYLTNFAHDFDTSEPEFLILIYQKL